MVPEECDLNTLVFLMTLAGDERGLNALMTTLVRFRELWDRDALLTDVLPSLSVAHPDRYIGYTLRHLCHEMHEFYRRANVKCLVRLCARRESFPRLAMLPKDACEALVANEVDYVPLDEIEGRISATLATVDPPCGGIVVPGERWDAHAKPILDCFQTIQESFNRFPGFTCDVQGLYQERVDGEIKFHTYVVRE